MSHPTRHSERLRAAQVEVGRQGASLLAVGLSSAMKYLTGFSDEPGERLLLLLVPAEGDALFVVPQLYEAQTRKASGRTDVVAWSDGDGAAGALSEALGRLAPQGCVLVDDGLWASSLLPIQKALPQCQFASAGSVLAELRMRKDSDEVALLERAGACADAAFAGILDAGFEGSTELELAAQLEEAMVEAGAEEPAFKTLVASGPNSALPHYRAGDRRVCRGDVVILDFGCRVGGYCSDISRTVVCGQPSEEVRRVHAAVKEAQRLAVAAVRPGQRACDIDRTAREYLASEDLGRQFIHRTGHGVGLDIHEHPYIAEGNSLPLREGMTFSIEPGVYFPDRFGVRIEDVVVVTESGARAMTAATHELRVVR
jgi:Xaa-Pro aminopeptidase